MCCRAERVNQVVSNCFSNRAKIRNLLLKLLESVCVSAAGEHSPVQEHELLLVARSAQTTADLQRVVMLIVASGKDRCDIHLIQFPLTASMLNKTLILRESQIQNNFLNTHTFVSHHWEVDVCGFE